MDDPRGGGAEWIPGSIASPVDPAETAVVAGAEGRAPPAVIGSIAAAPPHWPREGRALYSDLVRWLLDGSVTGTMDPELIHRVAMIFALAEFRGWEHVSEVDAREDGCHFRLVNMAMQPVDTDVPSWSYEVLGIHATDMRGALCILRDQRIRGSETLEGHGFWTLASNNNTSLEEQWRVARLARTKARNQCDILFGAEGRMKYVGLDAATHALEAEYNARGIATHLRRDGRVAMPIRRAGLAHMWIFTGSALPDVYRLRNWQ